jgi:ArsR family transcriptional regulator, lead/cadmium/zinc/bismuth-responsive transcriptional repressor
MAALKSAPVCRGNFVNPERVARVRKSAPDDGTIRRLADTFQVLGDPARLRVLHALAVAELCVCDLAPIVGLSPSALSHQLAILRRANLVRFRRDGQRVYYALDDKHIDDLLRVARRHAAHT